MLRPAILVTGGECTGTMTVRMRLAASALGAAGLVAALLVAVGTPARPPRFRPELSRRRQRRSRCSRRRRRADAGEHCATNTTDVSCRLATLVISPSTKPGTRSGILFNHYSLLGTAEQLLGLSKLGLATAHPTMTNPSTCRAAMPSHQCQLDSAPPRPGTCHHVRAFPTLASSGVFVEVTMSNSYNHAVDPPAGLAGNRVVMGTAPHAACVRLDQS
jgi:hypothetical protein